MLQIAVLLVCLAAVPLAAAEWVEYPAGGAVIHVRPGQERLAARLAAEVQHEMSRIAGKLGVTSVRQFPIYAYASRVEFFRDTGRQPDLLGQSLSSTGEIHIDVSGSQGPTRRVLAHELTHSLLALHLGLHIGALPTWVNEGIAGHLSDPVSPSQLAGVSRLIHRDGVLSLDELEDAFPSGSYRAAAYLQSRSMIAWLEMEHPGAVRRLVAALAGGQYFDEALQDAAGLTVEDWLAGWQQNVPAIVVWLTYLASPVVYSPLAVILIWVALRRLLRKKVEETDDDEDEDDNENERVDEKLPPLLEDM